MVARIQEPSSNRLSHKHCCREEVVYLFLKMAKCKTTDWLRAGAINTENKRESLTSSAMVGTTCFVWCKASCFVGKCHQTCGVRTIPWFEGPKLCFIWLSIKGTVVDFRGVFRKQKICQNCKFFIDEFCKFSLNWHFFIDKFCKFCWKIAGIKSWHNVWVSFSPYSDYLFFEYFLVVEITVSVFHFSTLSANFPTTNPTTFGCHLLHPNISPTAKTGRANEENIAPRCALWLFFGVRTKFHRRGSQSAPPFARLVLRWRREEKIS